MSSSPVQLSWLHRQHGISVQVVDPAIANHSTDPLSIVEMERNYQLVLFNSAKLDDESIQDRVGCLKQM
jgi:hypothetical protein